MNAIWQVLLALLAAVGLLALGWLTFGRLLTPVGGSGGGPVYAVVPASGDGAHLEQDVKGLLWLRGGELARFTIVIADGGLDGTGNRPLPGGAAGGVYQGVKLQTPPEHCGPRQNSRPCGGGVCLPVDKSERRWYDIPRERGGSSIHAGDGADIH